MLLSGYQIKLVICMPMKLVFSLLTHSIFHWVFVSQLFNKSAHLRPRILLLVDMVFLPHMFRFQRIEKPKRLLYHLYAPNQIVVCLLKRMLLLIVSVVVLNMRMLNSIRMLILFCLLILIYGIKFQMISIKSRHLVLINLLWLEWQNPRLSLNYGCDMVITLNESMNRVLINKNSMYV